MQSQLLQRLMLHTLGRQGTSHALGVSFGSLGLTILIWLERRGHIADGLFHDVKSARMPPRVLE